MLRSVEALQQSCTTPAPPWEFNASAFTRLFLRSGSRDEEWEARVCRT